MRHRARGLFAGLLAAISAACGGDGGGGAATTPVQAFTGGPISPLGSVMPLDLATGYFDGDARRDLVLPGGIAFTLNGMQLGAGVFLSDSDGSLSAKAPVTMGLPDMSGEIYRALSGHFRVWAHEDVLVVSSREYGVLLGNGDGTFDPEWSVGRVFQNPIVALDAEIYHTNSNFLDDFVVGTTQGSVATYGCMGAGVFQLLDLFVVAPGTAIIDVVAAYLDGDEIEDVVALDSASGIHVLFGDGGGSFTVGPSLVGGLPGEARGILLGRFDNAPGLDLAVMRVSSATPTPHASVLVVTGDGTGGFGVLTGEVDLRQGEFGYDGGGAQGEVVLLSELNSLVVAAGPSAPGSDRFLFLVRTDGAGVPSAERIPHPGSVATIRASDMDGDWLTDLAVVYEGETLLDFTIQVLYATLPR